MRQRAFGAVVLLGLALCLAVPSEAQDFLGKSFEAWRKELIGGKPAQRRSAAFALGRMGGLAAEALDSLVVRAKGDADVDVREACALASARIIRDLVRSGARGLTTDMRDQLRATLKGDKEARVRRSAAVALGAFGRGGELAVGDLVAALGDADASVRQNAARALGEIKAGVGADAVAGITRLLNDTEPQTRRDAAFALGQLGAAAGKSTVRPLLGLVRGEKDEVVRKTALDALSHVVGPDSQELAPDIYPLLDSRDPATVRAAALVLGKMGGEPAERAVPALRKLLTDSNEGDVALAAAALGNIREKAAPAAPELGKVLKASKNPYVRRNAAVALYNIGGDAAPAVLDLASALEPFALPAGTSAEARQAADDARVYTADALGKIAYPAIRPALPALSKVIRDDRSPNVRHKAVWALRSVSGNDLREHKLDEVLERVLDEKGLSNPLVRYDAGRVLALNLKEDAPAKAVLALVDMMQDDRLVVFKRVDPKLKGIGSEGSKGSATITVDQGGDARYMAIDPLLLMGAKATKDERVITALRKAAKDPSPKLSEEAKKALGKLGLD